MDTDKEIIKNLTAETQSTMRQEFLPNRETTIGQKAWFLRESCFCLSSSPDKQKKISLRPLWFDLAHHPESIEGRLRGEMSESLSARIGENRRLIKFKGVFNGALPDH
jgi:hypothetical protein